MQEVLDMDWYRARDQYWWKPRIILLFKLGYSARQMRTVSKGLIGRYVTHDVITRIWADEYEQYGSSLFKFLKEIYGS